MRGVNSAKVVGVYVQFNRATRVRVRLIGSPDIVSWGGGLGLFMGLINL